MIILPLACSWNTCKRNDIECTVLVLLVVKTLQSTMNLVLLYYMYQWKGNAFCRCSQTGGGRGLQKVFKDCQLWNWNCIKLKTRMSANRVENTKMHNWQTILTVTTSSCRRAPAVTPLTPTVTPSTAPIVHTRVTKTSSSTTTGISAIEVWLLVKPVCKSNRHDVLLIIQVNLLQPAHIISALVVTKILRQF